MLVPSSVTTIENAAKLFGTNTFVVEKVTKRLEDFSIVQTTKNTVTVILNDFLKFLNKVSRQQCKILAYIQFNS